MALQGTIKDFGLADILQLIGIQRKSGVLTVANDCDVVTVKFLKGEVVGADTERRSVEDLLGSVLVNTGRITEAQLQESLRLQRKTLQRLGHILVRKNLISEDDLVNALRVQSLQIVYRLFRWRDGRYSFQAQDDLEYDDRHFIPISAETILMEGARMVDEWPIIERRIKSDRMVLAKTDAARQVAPEVESLMNADIDIDLGFDATADKAASEQAADPPVTLSTEEREVLSLVDGRRTAEEISERTTLGEFDTYRILADLVTRNLVTEVRRPTATEAANRSRGVADRVLQGLFNAVVLLSVLAALATLNANPLSPWRVAEKDGGTNQLRHHASQARLERLERAIQIFYLDSGTFPQALEPLARNGYVDVEDLLDPWGRPYELTVYPGGYRLYGHDADGETRPDLTLSHEFTTIQRMMTEARRRGGAGKDDPH